MVQVCFELENGLAQDGLQAVIRIDNVHAPLYGAR